VDMRGHAWTHVDVHGHAWPYGHFSWTNGHFRGHFRGQMDIFVDICVDMRGHDLDNITYGLVSTRLERKMSFFEFLPFKRHTFGKTISS
jgi:hypothetical protein